MKSKRPQSAMLSLGRWPKRVMRLGITLLAICVLGCDDAATRRQKALNQKAAEVTDVSHVEENQEAVLRKVFGIRTVKITKADLGSSKSIAIQVTDGHMVNCGSLSLSRSLAESNGVAYVSFLRQLDVGYITYGIHDSTGGGVGVLRLPFETSDFRWKVFTPNPKKEGGRTILAEYHDSDPNRKLEILLHNEATSESNAVMNAGGPSVRTSLNLGR